MTTRHRHSASPEGRSPSSRLWLAARAHKAMLEQIGVLARHSQERGLRPRVVIFDYGQSSSSPPLKDLAGRLDLLVSVEKISPDLAASALDDRLRLLAKSRGIHGVLFPTAMPATHRRCLEAHPSLEALALDRLEDGFSPQMISFLQLAALARWEPRSQSAVVLYRPATAALAQTIQQQLQNLGLNVQRRSTELEPRGELSHCQLLWLCHGGPVELARLHLCPQVLVVDSGPAFELPASLTAEQEAWLASRGAEVCPAASGLAPLVDLNRLHRLFRRSLAGQDKRAVRAVARGRIQG